MWVDTCSQESSGWLALKQRDNTAQLLIRPLRCQAKYLMQHEMPNRRTLQMIGISQTRRIDYGRAPARQQLLDSATHALAHGVIGQVLLRNDDCIQPFAKRSTS